MIDNNKLKLKSCGSLWSSFFEMPVCIWLAKQKDGNPFMKFTYMKKSHALQNCFTCVKISHARPKCFTCVKENSHARKNCFTCMKKISHAFYEVHIVNISHASQILFTCM